MNPQEQPSTPVGRCELCNLPLDSDSRFEVVVPDSAFLHHDDPKQDGRRYTDACGPEHAQALVLRGLRSWDDEELWAAKLSRVSGSWNGAETTLESVATRLGLTGTQVLRAIRWHNDALPRAQRGNGSGPAGARIPPPRSVGQPHEETR